MEKFNKLNSELGTMIRNCRKQVGLTQDDLAKQLDTSRATIANYESGKFNIEFYKAMRMAKIFEFSLDAFLIHMDDKATAKEILIEKYKAKIEILENAR